MNFWHALLLGALQGLTEFLPVSSSGHLVLAERWMQLPQENLKSFDIAVHFGTLLAIIIYFWKDVAGLWQAFWGLIGDSIKSKLLDQKSAPKPEPNEYQKMVGYLILATIPAILVGVFLGDFFDALFRHPLSVAVLLMTVGILFFVIEYIAARVQQKKLGLRQSFLMGLAQTLALIPGVSRSGITISAGLVQGLKREEAARFSFLLGGITILAATVYAVFQVVRGKYLLPPPDILFAGVISAFAFGFAAISFMMKFVKSHKLHVFGIYRIALAIVIIVLTLTTGFFN